MLPVKHTVIYTFFAITSVQNTCFCSVFNALASKNPAKSCYVQCFFHFWPFFHCRKATKMTQNSISIPSCAQTPKNPRKMSKTPPYSGLGAKPFLAPPAKADIATAILTNVIEHLVLLFCPPISTPSPPKRCGRISWGFSTIIWGFITWDMLVEQTKIANEVLGPFFQPTERGNLISGNGKIPEPNGGL